VRFFDYASRPGGRINRNSYKPPKLNSRINACTLSLNELSELDNREGLCSIEGYSSIPWYLNAMHTGGVQPCRYAACNRGRASQKVIHAEHDCWIPAQSASLSEFCNLLKLIRQTCSNPPQRRCPPASVHFRNYCSHRQNQPLHAMCADQREAVDEIRSNPRIHTRAC
jgi:hypothetical protein